MSVNRDGTPPPMIGKIGPYTVFVTPPSTPLTPSPVFESPKKVAPPVQPPPHQFDSSLPKSGSALGFFKNAVVKVQNAHSRLDGHLAHWFGLNQSKYQWALDDYYETKGLTGYHIRSVGLSVKRRLENQKKRPPKHRVSDKKQPLLSLTWRLSPAPGLYTRNNYRCSMPPEQWRIMY